MVVISDPSLLPSYSFVLPIEANFKYEFGRSFLEQNYKVPLIAITVYLSCLYVGSKLMSNRKPFELRGLLLVWNIFLAAFSIAGTFRSLPEFFHVLTSRGFDHSVCKQVPQDGVYNFWCFLFVVSKIVELGDTGFIVARKQKLLFLHWYHHVTVLIFGWFSSMGPLSFGRYIMAMNFFVHSLMYSYYAARILKIRVPKQLAMTITSLQILQMIVGCFVTVYAQLAVNSGRPCEITQSTLNLSIVCYGSYLVLFLNFFVRSYLLGGKRKVQDVNANVSKVKKVM